MEFFGAARSIAKYSFSDAVITIFPSADHLETALPIMVWELNSSLLFFKTMKYSGPSQKSLIFLANGSPKLIFSGNKIMGGV